MYKHARTNLIFKAVCICMCVRVFARESVCEMVMGVFTETGFHRNGFSPKWVFTETGFHRNGFSPNPVLWRPFTERPFTEKYGFSSSASFHRMIHYYSPFNRDSKTGLRSSLAALEPKIQAFKVFSNF